MRVRGFQFSLFCATAALLAFSLGIWVAHGGAPEKIGPSGDGQGVAHAKSVRVILPDTLDGQSVPGHGRGLADRGRDLSPIFHSPQRREAKITSSLSGTASSRAQDTGGDATTSQTSASANESAGSEAFDDGASRQAAINGDSSPTSDQRWLRHLTSGTRHARNGHARHPFYFAGRRVRPNYGFGAFARLTSSDHGR